MKVLVDTREKRPLSFEKYSDEIILQSEKLDCGDYTLVGHDMSNDDYSVVIERKKDCLELVRNLVANWDTFENELSLLSAYKIKLLLVCTPNNFHKLYVKKLTLVHPNLVKSRLLDIQVKYGIQFMFFPSREAAEDYIYLLFKKILKVTEDEN